MKDLRQMNVKHFVRAMKLKMIDAMAEIERVEKAEVVDGTFLERMSELRSEMRHRLPPMMHAIYRDTRFRNVLPFAQETYNFDNDKVRKEYN